MNKRIALHIGYWAAILVLLTLFFGNNWQSRSLAFYFSTMLLPVVMGTTYFFNLVLVPKYLLTGRYGRLALYFCYMLIISLYLEMLVALISFVLIANYEVEVMGLQSMSIFILGGTLYLIVFVTSFIRLALQFTLKTREVQTLQAEMEKKQKATIQVRFNRNNHDIALEELLYVESLDDQVKIMTVKGEIMVREKISSLHKRLPNKFIRIHRSFVINREQIESFTKNQVVIQGIEIPIGRTYKKDVIQALTDSTKTAK